MICAYELLDTVFFSKMLLVHDNKEICLTSHGKLLIFFIPIFNKQSKPTDKIDPDKYNYEK